MRDWWDRLNDESTSISVYASQAKSWYSCAVAETRKRLPNVVVVDGGAPRDRRLERLGDKFYGAVANNNRARAKQLFLMIQRRVVNIMAASLSVLLLLALASPAAADTWAVDYISSTSWNGKFYPSGAYFFLCCDNGGAGGVLYGLTDVRGWKYLPGYYVYGATPLVPSDIPQITLTSNAFNPGTGNYEAVAVNISGVGGGGGGVVATPELAILRRQLGLLGPRMGGKIAGLFNPTLQRLTAWSAGKLLGASSWGDRIYLTDFTLQVVESCSGLMTIKWLLVLAVVCLAIGRVPWPWALAVIVAVPIIGFEVNVLRVVGIGLAYEQYGWAVKEWMGWGATGLGVGQVIGLGAIARRRR